jgi:hypothetical protein
MKGLQFIVNRATLSRTDNRDEMLESDRERSDIDLEDVRFAKEPCDFTMFRYLRRLPATMLETRHRG